MNNEKENLNFEDLQKRAELVKFTLTLWNKDDECPYKFNSCDKDYCVFCRDLEIVEEEMIKQEKKIIKRKEIECH